MRFSTLPESYERILIVLTAVLNGLYSPANRVRPPTIEPVAQTQPVVGVVALTGGPMPGVSTEMKAQLGKNLETVKDLVGKIDIAAHRFHDEAHRVPTA